LNDSDGPLAPVPILTADAFAAPWWGDALVLLVLLGGFAFLRAFEAGVIAMRDKDIRYEAQNGSQSAKMLVSLIDGINMFRTTVHTGTVTVGMIYGVFSLMRIPVRIGCALPSVPYSIVVIVSLIFFSMLLLCFGELLPQRLAQQKPLPFVRGGVYLFRLVAIVLRPITFVVFALFSFLTRRFNLDSPSVDRLITEEELRSLLDASSEAGHIEDEDKDLIENIFEFDDKTVFEVMTHRTSISAIRADAGWEDVLSFVVSEKYSRFPVYEDSIDNIVGILHAKDLLGVEAAGASDSFSLADLMRQPLYTPESKIVKALFAEMRQNRAPMAIVIDEYGGTAGIVTFEDLLEEIVGDIDDEYDEVSRSYVKITSHVWLMDGALDLDEVADACGVILPDEYETLSGFVIDLLDRIPDEREHPEVSFGELKFKVLSMEDNRIRRLRVVREEAKEDEADDAP
jgi:putative hemolysin